MNRPKFQPLAGMHGHQAHRIDTSGSGGKATKLLFLIQDFDALHMIRERPLWISLCRMVFKSYLEQLMDGEPLLGRNRILDDIRRKDAALVE